jgi:peroxiredoxin Q/BCP
VRIVGVSFDSPADNQTFAVNQNWTFELWSDEAKALALYYGAAQDASQPVPTRITKVLDPQGALVLEYPKVDPATHPQEVLEDCRALFGP